MKPTKRYICVGTTGFRKSKTTGGQLLVFSLKSYVKHGITGYKFTRLGQLFVESDSGFLSIQSFGSYLLAATATDLHRVKIDTGSREIIFGDKVSTRTPLRSIQTVDNDIYAVGSGCPLNVYQYDAEEKKLEFATRLGFI